LSEQEAGGSVPEVVDTDMRQLVPAQEFPELPVGIPWVDRCPARRRENQVHYVGRDLGRAGLVLPERR
jgi:hypothetical protein